jgi:hypothetical protein
MKAKIWMPRLKPLEVEQLTECLTRLNQIHDSVAATNIGGRLAVMHLCVEVYRTIEGVLGKVQRAVVSAQQRAGDQQAGQDGPAEV